MGGSHWVCSITKDKETFYFDSFGGNPDNVQLNQLSNEYYIIIIKLKIYIFVYVVAIVYIFSL